MIVRSVRLVLAAVLSATVLAATAAGCAAPPDHVDADVSFAQMMVPHHRQAVEMSALATTRAASPEVRDLASRIQQAQTPEIDRMTRLLASWGAPATAMTGGMPGMMSDADMGRLAGSSGAAFDRGFLEMMIGHHSGAITMARTELDQGRNADARELARSITDAQQREIAQIQALLARA